MGEGADTQALGGPADAYDRHVGRYGAKLASALVEVADVQPGQRALDVGCGPGPLTRVLAERLGADNVAAVDPSEPFVAACRSRVPAADVRVAVAEELPFAANEFDVVLAQLVVQLMDDRDRGVREMARVARPGGVVAACVWASRAMPLLQSFWDAALAVAPEQAGALDEGRRVGYPSPPTSATYGKHAAWAASPPVRSALRAATRASTTCSHPSRRARATRERPFWPSTKRSSGACAPRRIGCSAGRMAR